MRKRSIPLLAPLANAGGFQPGFYATKARGLDVLNSPRLNKGSAFTMEERKGLGLTGLLPPGIHSLDSQVKSAFLEYELLPDARGRHLYLTALHDRNEVLYYRLFSEHLREMIPVMNDPTLGLAAEHYPHECRRPRGVYLSIDHPDEIAAAFANLNAGPEDIDLILATDAEQILGLGDVGVAGIEVAIRKLAIYTAAGGIDPRRVVPVMLDVGTDRENLWQDPAYIGGQHRRVRGEVYDAFVDRYVEVVTKLFPRALLLWKDFAPATGRRILERYRKRICTFNADIQATGAIGLAAAISAARASGVPLRSQRVVIAGAGMEGIGIAEQLREAMVSEGLTEEEATERFWLVDRQGLVAVDRKEELPDFQKPFARTDGPGGATLAEVARLARPTILIGASRAAGIFTEAIVRGMAQHTERPIILVLSRPNARGEATASDLIRWTEGRALIATGIASEPVTYRGVTYAIGQMNSAKLYPGLALGAIVTRAREVSDGMLAAAARAVSSMVTVKQPGASLLPHVDDLRTVSLTVAVAVAEAAQLEGLARVEIHDIVQAVQDAMWTPEYRRIVAA